MYVYIYIHIMYIYIYILCVYIYTHIMCIYIYTYYVYIYIHTSIGTIGLDPIETYFVLSTPLKNQRQVNWDRHPSSESCDCFLNMSETHTHTRFSGWYTSIIHRYTMCFSQNEVFHPGHVYTCSPCIVFIHIYIYRYIQISHCNTSLCFVC